MDFLSPGDPIKMCLTAAVLERDIMKLDESTAE